MAQAGPRHLRDTLSVTGRSADTERLPRAALSSLPPASSSGSVWAFTSLLSCKLRRPLYKDHRIRLHKLRVNQPVLVFPPCSLNVRPCPDILLLSTLFLTPFPQVSTWCLHSAFQWPGPPKACPLASIPSFYSNIQTFPLSQSYSVLGPT